MGKKLVILDYINEVTLVIPYDTNVFESTEDCILQYNEQLDEPISLSNCNYMVVTDFVLKIV